MASSNFKFYCKVRKYIFLKNFFNITLIDWLKAEARDDRKTIDSSIFNFFKSVEGSSLGLILQKKTKGQTGP